MTLTYRPEIDWWTRRRTGNVILSSDGRCDGPHWEWVWDDETHTTGHNADDPAATLAHVGFEIVAQVLAEPLRRAYEEHSGRPHGDKPGSVLPFRGHCPECQRLMAMLPDGDQPVAFG